MEAVAAFAAAAVALVVGLFGVFGNRRTALEAQRASDRSRALGRAAELIALHGGALQDVIFNLTVARPVQYSDPVTGPTSRDLYGPNRRFPHAPTAQERAELDSLIAAHGNPTIDRAFFRWLEALEALDQRYLTSEAAYYENQRESLAGDFEPERAAEEDARASLGGAIRSTLHRTRHATRQGRS